MKISFTVQELRVSTFEGTLAALSEVLEFHGDHEYIYHMGWKKKNRIAMKFITCFFSQPNHSKVVYIRKKGADMKNCLCGLFFSSPYYIYGRDRRKILRILTERRLSLRR